MKSFTLNHALSSKPSMAKGSLTFGLLAEAAEQSLK